MAVLAGVVAIALIAAVGMRARSSDTTTAGVGQQVGTTLRPIARYGDLDCFSLTFWEVLDSKKRQVLSGEAPFKDSPVVVGRVGPEIGRSTKSIGTFPLQYDVTTSAFSLWRDLSPWPHESAPAAGSSMIDSVVTRRVGSTDPSGTVPDCFNNRNLAEVGAGSVVVAFVQAPQSGTSAWTLSTEKEIVFFVVGADGTPPLDAAEINQLGVTVRTPDGDTACRQRVICTVAAFTKEVNETLEPHGTSTMGG